MLTFSDDSFLIIFIFVSHIIYYSIPHARDAHWCKIFFLEHADASMYIPFNVSVYHDRGASGRAHPLVAESNFEVTQVLQSPAGVMCDQLENGIK
jgi:hypothetical protein